MLVNAAIVAYLIFAVFVDAPIGGRPKRLAKKLFRFAGWLGFGYAWSMYAPDAPVTTDLVEFYSADGDAEPVNLTPPFLARHDNFGAASGLRFITFQRHLAREYSWPARRAICDWIAANPRGEGRVVRSSTTLRKIAVVKRSIETPTFFSGSDVEGTVRSRAIATVDVSSTAS